MLWQACGEGPFLFQHDNAPMHKAKDHEEMLFPVWCVKERFKPIEYLREETLPGVGVCAQTGSKQIPAAMGLLKRLKPEEQRQHVSGKRHSTITYGVMFRSSHTLFEC